MAEVSKDSCLVFPKSNENGASERSSDDEEEIRTETEEEDDSIEEFRPRYFDLDNPDDAPIVSGSYFKRRNELPDLSNSIMLDVEDLGNGRVKKVVQDLMEEKEVTVVAEGVGVGRLADIHWIALGGREQEYLFHVHTMGQAVFDQGLTAILESSHILKIVFDSDVLTDWLFHKFSVGLRNVFDIQVGQAVIRKRKQCGFLSKTSDTLSFLLRAYTDVEVNRLPRLNPTPHMEAERVQEKPISRVLERVLVAKAKYIRKVKEGEMVELLADFNTAVAVHLGSVRDAPLDRIPELLRRKDLPLVKTEESDSVGFWEREPGTGHIEVLDPTTKRRISLSDRFSTKLFR